MSQKNLKIVFTLSGLVLLSLLVSGVTLPMISIKLNANVDAGLAKFDNEVFHTTRSIVQTTQNLIERERYLVGILIFLFSVVTPLFKLFCQLVLVWGPHAMRKRMTKAINFVSKWSMADVFVVALFLAFLATDGSGSINSQRVSVFGMNLNIKIQAMMESTLHQGFYLFLSYCLLSIVFWQLQQKFLNHPDSNS